MGRCRRKGRRTERVNSGRDEMDRKKTSPGVQEICVQSTISIYGLVVKFRTLITRLCECGINPPGFVSHVVSLIYSNIKTNLKEIGVDVMS